MVEHREVEAVDIGDVAQLAARGVAFAGLLDLDHVGAEPGQQLRAGRARLDVREVENADAVSAAVYPVEVLLAMVDSSGSFWGSPHLYMVCAIVPGA